jgi:hypothetical protein
MSGWKGSSKIARVSPVVYQVVFPDSIRARPLVTIMAYPFHIIPSWYVLVW